MLVPAQTIVEMEVAVQGISPRDNQPFTVRTPEGLSGRAEPIDDGARLLVSFGNGRSIVVARDLIEPQRDGTYVLRAPLPQMKDDDEVVVPVIREELDIRKQVVEQPRGYRIHKRVTERQQRIIQLLYRDSLDVERVPKHEFIDRVPAVRYEGDTMVIPLCEEVLVVEKRLLLKEEVHVRRREGQVEHAETVVLRSEEAAIERFGDGVPNARTPERAGLPR